MQGEASGRGEGRSALRPVRRRAPLRVDLPSLVSCGRRRFRRVHEPAHRPGSLTVIARMRRIRCRVVRYCTSGSEASCNALTLCCSVQQEAVNSSRCPVCAIGSATNGTGVPRCPMRSSPQHHPRRPKLDQPTPLQLGQINPALIRDRQSGPIELVPPDCGFRHWSRSPLAWWWIALVRCRGQGPAH